MEENPSLFEAFMHSAVEFGRINLDILKLKALDKTSDVIATIVSHSVVFIFFLVFLLFLNLGLALWLGDILGKIYYGFLAVGIIYGIMGLFLHMFLHTWTKRRVANYIIQDTLK